MSVDLNQKLLHAVKYEKSKSDIKSLIKKGAKAVCKDADYGMPPLLWAICNNCYKAKLVGLLLDNGASVKDVDYNGWTALHYAVCVRAGVDLVQLLLLRRADAQAATTRASSQFPPRTSVLAMAKASRASEAVIRLLQATIAERAQAAQAQAAALLSRPSGGGYQGYPPAHPAPPQPQPQANSRPLPLPPLLPRPPMASSTTRTAATAAGAGAGAAAAVAVVPSTTQQQPQQQQSSTSPLCVVCMELAICTVLDPCGHAVMCEPCASLVGQQCPMCRQPFTKAIKMYLP